MLDSDLDDALKVYDRLRKLKILKCHDCHPAMFDLCTPCVNIIAEIDVALGEIEAAK